MWDSIYAMITGHKFRCYPDVHQQQTLVQWIGCQRYIYNAKVQEDKYFRALARKALSFTGKHAPIDQQYSHFKDPELSPWLFEVPSQLLRNGAVRWKQAYSRFFQKLGGRPTIQRKHGVQSVWLTSELFEFVPTTNADTGEITHRLMVGTNKYPIGEICFNAHHNYVLPASISISVDNGKWYVSFSADDGLAEIRPQDVIAELEQYSEVELQAMAVGVDRGVTIAACVSDGGTYTFTLTQQKRMAKRERARKRYQRKMARRVKGSAGFRDAKRRATACQQYAKNVRHDFAHQVSYRLVETEGVRLIGFEDLRIQSMTRKARAKKDVSGKYVRNNAAAKSGLNKSILQRAWGKTQDFAKYKALRRNKIVVEVTAQYTSQECSKCGHVHSDNRLSQSDFFCQRCGYRVNADYNASINIAKRAVRLILSGGHHVKTAKKTMCLKPKVGAGCSEPLEFSSNANGDHVSHDAGNQVMQRSLKLETPATSRRL